MSWREPPHPVDGEKWELEIEAGEGYVTTSVRVLGDTDGESVSRDHNAGAYKFEVLEVPEPNPEGWSEGDTDVLLRMYFNERLD